MAMSTVRAYLPDINGEEPSILEGKIILVGKVTLYEICNDGVIVLDEFEQNWYVTNEDWWHYQSMAESF
jgi:hypothetical protein